jgi:hypothetical protein
MEVYAKINHKMKTLGIIMCNFCKLFFLFIASYLLDGYKKRYIPIYSYLCTANMMDIPALLNFHTLSLSVKIEMET